MPRTAARMMAGASTDGGTRISLAQSPTSGKSRTTSIRLAVRLRAARDDEHVAGLLWARAAGVELEHVSYNAGSDAMKDVIAGRLGHVFDVGVTAIPLIKAGAVRGLAIPSAEVRKKLQELASTFYPAWPPPRSMPSMRPNAPNGSRLSGRPSARADARAL